MRFRKISLAFFRGASKELVLWMWMYFDQVGNVKFLLYKRVGKRLSIDFILGLLGVKLNWCVIMGKLIKLDSTLCESDLSFFSLLGTGFLRFIQDQFNVFACYIRLC